MKRLLLPVVLLVGCNDPIEVSFAGRLMNVMVVTVSDDCSERRFTGDAGTQFVATDDRGRLQITMSERAIYGSDDATLPLEGVRRLALPLADLGRLTLGSGSGCEGTFGDWTGAPPALTLRQDLPGKKSCPTGPGWLPSEYACTSIRQFRLTDLGPCESRCLAITAAPEVSCQCP